jgi:alpha-tubulin suppressor-like RCC1 family protein
MTYSLKDLAFLGLNLALVVACGRTGLNQASGVATGATASCSIVSGAVKCWGWYGSQDVTTPIYSDTPVVAYNSSNAAQVSCGWEFACARLSTGVIYCWGKNEQGQLGRNSTLATGLPSVVHGISTAADVSAGYQHACAVLTDGSVSCWGNNDSGQYGAGYTGSFPNPIQSQGAGYAKAVSAGQLHSCALRTNGSVQCWGNNSFGQLGIGPVAYSLSPVTVTGF